MPEVEVRKDESFEAALRRELPALAEVNVHLEPRGAAVHHPPPAARDDAALRHLVAQAAEEVAGLEGCHDVQIRAARGGWHVSLHCLADADLPIAEAHRLADQVERQIVTRLPQVVEVLAHVEPKGEA